MSPKALLEAKHAVGPIEIAERLNTNRDRVDKWHERKFRGFPDPWAIVSKRPIWDWREIDKWRKKNLQNE